jgi:hypothetical protein
MKKRTRAAFSSIVPGYIIQYTDYVGAFSKSEKTEAQCYISELLFQDLV